ncbi:hypothetical protein L3Q82_001583 [Scortum barcoo]|uniref:Uncharacterized protein n=1 Tax=Scortum barcoo TaxID=214431 RepID=A0ACB8W946_9TELE|nr:hypothetical protein L3Q82_001583 [Scortum barcoo]
MSHREEAPGEDPGHAGETMSLGWPGNASGPPGRAGESVWVPDFLFGAGGEAGRWKEAESVQASCQQTGRRPTELEEEEEEGGWRGKALRYCRNRLRSYRREERGSRGGGEEENQRERLIWSWLPCFTVQHNSHRRQRSAVPVGLNLVLYDGERGREVRRCRRDSEQIMDWKELVVFSGGGGGVSRALCPLSAVRRSWRSSLADMR